jgi:hypothetical protein
VTVKPAQVLIVVAAALVLLFLGLNWGLLGAPMAVSFGFAHVTLPFGLVLLGFALLLLAVFLWALLRVQLTLLSTHRRHTAELRSQRELVEQAESSRLTELRQYLQTELAGLREEQRRSEQRLHEEILSTGNALSACVGEIDERLERHFPAPPAQQP